MKCQLDDHQPQFISAITYIKYYQILSLVGGFNQTEKYEFISWDYYSQFLPDAPWCWNIDLYPLTITQNVANNPYISYIWLWKKETCSKPPSSFAWKILAVEPTVCPSTVSAFGAFCPTVSASARRFASQDCG